MSLRATLALPLAALATAALAVPLAATPAAANLIVNGDFEAGNTGFSSDHAYSPATLVPPDVYAIVADPSPLHGQAASYGDHTTGSGLMMAINGSTMSGELVWGQTVAVLANATYDFAAYISSWIAASPASLVFTVNGMTIGTLNAPGQTGVWDLAFATWNAGASTSATIEIRNANTAFGGNDFALDDIYFGNPVFSQPVAEPAAIGVFGLALAGLMVAGRRRR